jgi:hypothetical protein
MQLTDLDYQRKQKHVLSGAFGERKRSLVWTHQATMQHANTSLFSFNWFTFPIM